MKHWKIGLTILGIILIWVAVAVGLVYILNQGTESRKQHDERNSIILNNVVLDSKEEIRYYRAQNEYNLCFKKEGVKVCVTASNTVGETLMVGTKLNIKYNKVSSQLMDYTFVEENGDGSEDATSN